MTDSQFILASSSPRRQELLNQLGLAYTVLPVDIDETPEHGEDPDTYVTRMAGLKAMAGIEYANNLPVLAADTICVLGGCPRIEAVARESGFESIYLIK